jgi:hypothetical protein
MKYLNPQEVKSKQALASNINEGNSDLQFKFLTAVINKTVVFWDVMQYTDFSEEPIAAMFKMHE